jgi:hypothetical protein
VSLVIAAAVPVPQTLSGNNSDVVAMQRRVLATLDEKDDLSRLMSH